MDRKEFFKLSPARWGVGIGIGLLYAFTFYSFLYLGRETLRIFSARKDHLLWVLTEQEVNFYNLFFAFVAVIFAQSVCFTYWFHRPRHVFTKREVRRNAIVNDQRALNLYFLHWFAKLAVLFGLLFGLTFPAGFLAFSFYPDYRYVFILIVVVLFFQSWSSLHLILRKNSLKWMLGSMLVVGTLSFSLSKINLIDYRSINQQITQNSVFNNFRLTLPEAVYYDFDYFNYKDEIYFGELKKAQDQEAGLIFNREEMSLEKIGEKIRLQEASREIYERGRTNYKLFIHRDVKMGLVNQLKNELTNAGVQSVTYAVTPIEPEYEDPYYYFQNYNLEMYLQSKEWKVLPQFSKEEYYEEFEHHIQVHLHTSRIFRLNEQLVHVSHLKATLKQVIETNPDYLFIFYVDDKMSFSDYLTLVSSFKGAVYELRNEMALKKYGKEYYRLWGEEESKVRVRFPLNLVEEKVSL